MSLLKRSWAETMSRLSAFGQQTSIVDNAMVDGEQKTRPPAVLHDLLEQVAQAGNREFALSLALTLLATSSLDRGSAERLIELCYRIFDDDPVNDPDRE